MTRPAALRDKRARRYPVGVTASDLIKESHVERAVTELLEWDGWRAFKMEQNFSERKQKRTGEKGMPDHLYVRYKWSHKDAADAGWGNADSEVLWIEFKAPGKEPRQDQLDWHALERARGALVLVVDSIDDFRTWYRESGLRRSPNRWELYT